MKYFELHTVDPCRYLHNNKFHIIIPYIKQKTYYLYVTGINIKPTTARHRTSYSTPKIPQPHNLYKHK